MNIILSNELILNNVPSVLSRRLKDELQMDNPKWIENQRMGRWNRGTERVLKFYRSNGQSGLIIPKGYMRRLILLCRDMNLPFEVNDRRRLFPSVHFNFAGRLKPFQEYAAKQMMAKDFGTLNAPTGSGKTVIALFMAAERRQPVLIVVHTKELAKQWMERIETFLGIDIRSIGLIGDGKTIIGETVTVALVQSLYKYSEFVSPRIGFLIVDECHRTPSRTFTEAVRAFDSRYMLGLSATPYRRDKLSSLIFWFLGDIHHTIEKRVLEEKGHILKAHVVIRETDFSPFYDPVNEYSKMLSELTIDDDRNHMIAKDVAEEVARSKTTDQVCLVLSDRKKHCETLCAILKLKYALKVELLTGDLSLYERKGVMERILSGKSNVLVATGQLIGEGFDCKELSTLFLATPIRFTGRVIQYLGRVLRPHEGKSIAKVYDYVDVKVDVLRMAAQYRMKVYHS